MHVMNKENYKNLYYTILYVGNIIYCIDTGQPQQRYNYF